MVMRRKTQWYTTQTVFQDLAAAGQTNQLLFSAASSVTGAAKGHTVTRIIVDVGMRSNAVNQNNFMTWGIVTVNADARAAGAFPDSDELTERAGWLVRGRLLNIMDTLNESSQWTGVKLDLRSQRVIRNEDEELHLIVDNAGSFVFEWTAFMRVLMKEPL